MTAPKARPRQPRSPTPEASSRSRLYLAAEDKAAAYLPTRTSHRCF